VPTITLETQQVSLIESDYSSKYSTRAPLMRTIA
jgi:hypothetical protein